MDHLQERNSLVNQTKKVDKLKCFLIFFVLLHISNVGALIRTSRIGIPASSLNLIESTSKLVVTTPAPIVYVPNTFEVKFELDELQFSALLADHSSEEFKSLTKVLEEKLRDPISYKYGDHFSLTLIKFESASPLNTTSSTIRIRWLDNEDKTTSSPTIKDVTKQLEQYMKVRDGYIGGYHIASESLNVEDLIDDCKTNRTSCTHICDFQTTTLMFKCSCPDNLILQNTFSCVDRNSVKPTEKPEPVNIANILEIAQLIGGVISDIRYEDKKETTTSSTNTKTTTTTTTPKPETIINGTLVNSTILQSNTTNNNDTKEGSHKHFRGSIKPTEKTIFTNLELKTPEDMKPSITESSLLFQNESHVLLKIDSNVDISKILSIISSATSSVGSIKPTEKPKPVNVTSILEIAQSIGGIASDIRYENKKETTTASTTTTTTTTATTKPETIIHRT